MPPVTPRITTWHPLIAEILDVRTPARGYQRPRSQGSGGPRSALDRLGDQQARVDLPHRDRQRLLLRRGLHQRTDVLQQALAELAVVRVDLPSPLGGEDHQSVLGRTALQQLVDRRVGNAFRIGDGHETPSKNYGDNGRQPSNPSNSSAARSTESFTIVTSNSLSAASSSSACSNRSRIVSGSSVPRPIRRRCSSSTLGGARKTSNASGMALRTWRAPCRSIFSRAGRPRRSRCSTGARGVP